MLEVWTAKGHIFHSVAHAQMQLHSMGIELQNRSWFKRYFFMGSLCQASSPVPSGRCCSDSFEQPEQADETADEALNCTPNPCKILRYIADVGKSLFFSDIPVGASNRHHQGDPGSMILLHSSQ